jgi:ATP-dependent helicase HrpA
VETTRLFGRGVANIEPQWLEQVAGHLLKKQLLDPHWEKKGAQVSALERATLYGLVVYSGRRVDFTKVDPVAAREIFIREALVAGQWETKFPFLQANRKLVREVEGLEHKSRRQDVLVDDELIFAFYDAQLPADVASGITFEHWYRQVEGPAAPAVPDARRTHAPPGGGHHHAVVPGDAALGGVDCAATYLHEPGDAKDGLTVSVPLFVLNQVSEERCEWLVTGMLKDKIQALLKSLPQRPRSRLVPLPESASRLAEALSEPELFGTGSLTDVLLKRVRDMTSIDVKRADFKLDMLPPHLFMNLRVVDEHGRQLGMGRNLGALKAELGAQARGAFQALAGLNVKASPGRKQPPTARTWFEQRGEGSRQGRRRARAGRLAGRPALHGLDLRRAARADGSAPRFAIAHRLSGAARRGRCRDHRGVRRARGRRGQAPSRPAPPVRAAAEGRAQVPREEHPRPAEDVGGLHAAGHLGRAAHADHRRGHRPRLPAGAVAHRRVRLQEAPGGGRGRLTLIANEVARLASTILVEYAAAARKIKDTKIQPDAVQDAAQQLQRLVGKRFIADAPWTQLQHFARYLKAIVLRLDKLRADPARDAAKLAELKPQDQRYWRLVAERKGVVDERMLEFRWLLEELRVSFFAQELRTPQPVSVKRLDKAWAIAGLIAG